jgi:atypical dual specificity phosphatase
MPHPGYGEALAGNLAELKASGVAGLVSLSQSAPDVEAVQSAGLRHLHAPVIDFSAPTPGQLDKIIDFIDVVAGEGGATAVHCTSGYGRTGTVLAAYLAAREGLPCNEAIRRVREVRPGSVETPEQERAVAEFAKGLPGNARRR